MCINNQIKWLCNKENLNEFVKSTYSSSLPTISSELIRLEVVFAMPSSRWNFNVWLCLSRQCREFRNLTGRRILVAVQPLIRRCLSLVVTRLLAQIRRANSNDLNAASCLASRAASCVASCGADLYSRLFVCAVRYGDQHKCSQRLVQPPLYAVDIRVVGYPSRDESSQLQGRLCLNVLATLTELHAARLFHVIDPLISPSYCKSL